MIREAKDEHGHGDFEQYQEEQNLFNNESISLVETMTFFKGYIEELVEQLDNLRESEYHAEELNSQLLKANNERKFLSEKLEDIELENERLQIILEEDKGRVQQPSEERYEIKKLRAEINKLLYYKNEQKNIIKNVSGNFDEERKQLQDKINKLEKSKNKAIFEAESLKKQLSALQDEKKEQKSEIENFQKENLELRFRLGKIEEEVEGMTVRGIEINSAGGLQKALQKQEKVISEYEKFFKNLPRAVNKKGKMEETERSYFCQTDENREILGNISNMMQGLERMYNKEKTKNKKISSIFQEQETFDMTKLRKGMDQLERKLSKIANLA